MIIKPTNAYPQSHMSQYKPLESSNKKCKLNLDSERMRSQMSYLSMKDQQRKQTHLQHNSYSQNPQRVKQNMLRSRSGRALSCGK